MREMATVAGQVEHPERLATQEVSYPSESAKIPGYLARPRENGRYPGIVILHDIFGVSDHARDVARRFANVGFTVLVPDCFARIEIGTDETIDKIRVRAGQLEDRLTVRDIEGAAALLLACSSDKIDATIDCWGGSVTSDTGTSPLHPVPVSDMAKNIKRPVYAVFGADDENPSQAHAAQLRERFQQEGKLGLVTMETFANAGHAFFADGRPDRYREKAAFELWPKMVSFFKTHLS